ncbi:hypothetical protein AXF42_Ash003319 [Apostasia shenzhenica]|uniref:Uncharacterized protein n=1 Tax=Apostasia shenzhenica TaxID=1088818 RepID=A0A2I0BFW2_9ASPA|nr:hypothetical protein AXF42_Ash003319 [Apostasia shenzhenica]
MLSAPVNGSCSILHCFLLIQPSSGVSCRLLGFSKVSTFSLSTHRRRWGKRGTLKFKKPLSAELTDSEEEWLKKLPEKKKPLYAHSLPCIEAWLKKLGFNQSSGDRAVWLIERLDWHAQLSLDVTDLYVRYLKSGPGNLEKDVERRFSYALSREDIENAILGGP